jgi:hypothetical protein
VQLPDREFYSLQSLGKRWTCDVEEILEYCRMQYLIPAIAHGELEVEKYVGPLPTPDLGGGLSFDGCEFVDRYVVPPGALHLPLFPFHLTGPVLATALIDISRSVLSGRPRGSNEWLLPVGHVDPQPLSELLIHNSEVARFEKQFGGAAETPPTSKKINNALKTIAILARVLAAVAPPNVKKVVGSLTLAEMKKSGEGELGTPLEPNANAIAELVLDHLSQAGIEPTGQGNSVVRDRIAKGLKLLQDET